MADASIGEVEIELNGKTETLRCSLEAAKRVNAGGGYISVLRNLGAMDLDFYVLVVAAGLDKKPGEVDEAVYRTGLPSLTAPLSAFVECLANGGKPVRALPA